MDRVFLDSNIIIAMAKAVLGTSFLENKQIMVSDISRLEVFGYHGIGKKEQLALNQFFENVFCVTVSKEIIDEAIKLRQAKKMSVGDAVIAATSLQFELPIYTANTKDFHHIKGLELINPLPKHS